MSRPAWSYRVQALCQQRIEDQGVTSRNRSTSLFVKSEDFDEDISDYVSESSPSDHEGGDDGDDRGYRYLNEKRTWRKLEITESGRKKVVEQKQARHRDELEYETRQMNRVQEAIDKAEKQKKPPPLQRLGGRELRLFSTDHVKHCPEEVAPTRYIEFYSDDEWDNPYIKSNELSGHIYILGNTVFDLGYFTQPKYPGTKTYSLPNPYGYSKVEVQFIDNNHLTLKISPKPVFSKYGAPVPSDAPDVLLYYGKC